MSAALADTALADTAPIEHPPTQVTVINGQMLLRANTAPESRPSPFRSPSLLAAERSSEETHLVFNRPERSIRVASRASDEALDRGGPPAVLVASSPPEEPPKEKAVSETSVSDSPTATARAAMEWPMSSDNSKDEPVRTEVRNSAGECLALVASMPDESNADRLTVVCAHTLPDAQNAAIFRSDTGAMLFEFVNSLSPMIATFQISEGSKAALHDGKLAVRIHRLGSEVVVAIRSGEESGSGTEAGGAEVSDVGSGS